MSPETMKDTILAARTLYDDVEDSKLVQFLKGNDSLRSVSIDDFLNIVPIPINHRQRYGLQSNGEVLEEQDLIEASNDPIYYAFFEDLIVKELEGLFPGIFNENTGERSEKRVEIYRRLFLRNLGTFSKSYSSTFEEFKDNLRTRKFEKNKFGRLVYAFSHPIKGELLLPKDAPYEVDLAYLGHDSVEDSHRHKALQAWLSMEELTSNQEEMLEGMGVELTSYQELRKIRDVRFDEILSNYIKPGSKELYAIQRLRERAALSEEDERIVKSFSSISAELEGFITAELGRYRTASKVYDEKFSDIVEDLLIDIGVEDLGDESETFVRQLIYGMSRKQTESYHKYLQGPNHILEKDPAYWLATMKMCDRITNTKFNPNLKGKKFLKQGAKVLQDGVKNTDLSFATNKLAKKLWPKSPIVSEQIDEHRREEYFLRQVAISDETNTNMDRIMNVLKTNRYALQPLSEGGVIQELHKWYRNFETRLFLSGAYGELTKLDSEPRENSQILSTRGVVKRLDEYLRGENILAAVAEGKDPRATFELYTFAATIKTLSSIILGYNPFVERFENELLEIAAMKKKGVTKIEVLDSGFVPIEYRLRTKEKGLHPFWKGVGASLNLLPLAEQAGFTHGIFTGDIYRPTKRG